MYLHQKQLLQEQNFTDKIAIATVTFNTCLVSPVLESVAVACGQGMQVMHCMSITSELLRNHLFFLYKEHHDFGTKIEKSETDFKQRPFIYF